MVSFPPEFPFVRRPDPPADDRAAAMPEPAPSAPIDDQPPVTAPPPESIAPVTDEPPAADAPAFEPVPDVEPVPAPLPPVPPARAATPRAGFRSITRASFAERRKSRRDALTATALVRLDAQQGPPSRVAISEISVAGVRFRSLRPMDLGDKGQIRLEVGPLRWTTRLRVVHCSRDEDGTATIGCAFLRTELLRPWPITTAA